MPTLGRVGLGLAQEDEGEHGRLLPSSSSEAALLRNLYRLGDQRAVIATYFTRILAGPWDCHPILDKMNLSEVFLPV